VPRATTASRWRSFLHDCNGVTSSLRSALAPSEAFLALYSTILCAVDFSEHSRRALRLGLALAARLGSRVTAVHVIDQLLAEAAASMSGAAQLRADAEAELRSLVSAEQSATPGSPSVTTIVRIGPPAQEILASARIATAALVVMGTQGLGGLRKLFFGSITEKVLRDAHVPVLAVPFPEPADSGGVPVIELVIASVELDNSADAVAGHAATFASGFGLPLTLLHVVPPVEGMPRAVEAARVAERLHEASAQARLTELAGRVPAGVDVSTEVRCGAAAEEIAAAAASRHALVTIASGGDDTHHRPGSIAYRVLCLSDSPVLAIPFKGESRSET
jgi:nucleotide-binding universal stress UspA family protein